MYCHCSLLFKKLSKRVTKIIHLTRKTRWRQQICIICAGFCTSWLQVFCMHYWQCRRQLQAACKMHIVCGAGGRAAAQGRRGANAAERGWFNERQRTGAIAVERFAHSPAVRRLSLQSVSVPTRSKTMSDSRRSQICSTNDALDILPHQGSVLIFVWFLAIAHTSSEPLLSREIISFEKLICSWYFPLREILISWF
jgi:hypothetical protein